MSPFSSATRLLRSKASRSSRNSSATSHATDSTITAHGAGAEVDPVLREIEEAADDAEYVLVEPDGPTDQGKQRSRLGHRGPPVMSGSLLAPAPGVRPRRKLMSRRSERALGALREDVAASGHPMPVAVGGMAAALNGAKGKTREA